MHKTKKIIAALFVIVAMLAMAIPAFADGDSAAPAADTAQTQQSESVQADSSLGLKAVATGIAIGLAAAGGAVGMQVGGGHCPPARGGEQDPHHPDAGSGIYRNGHYLRPVGGYPDHLCPVR